MRRKRLLVAAIGCILALSLGCGHAGSPVGVTTTAVPNLVGSGVIVREPRPVGGFDALSVTGPLEVVLEAGSAPSLEITADDNIVPLVTAEVRGNRLFLGFVSPASFSSSHKVSCRVTAGAVGDVEVTGAGSVELRGLDLDRLRVSLSGASAGSAAGSVERLVLDASGASRWTSGSLASRAVVAVVSGSSHAVVRAGDTLAATVSGASTLEYLGDPVLTPDVTGLSVLRRIGD